jgi:thiamine-phosphate pyrophosphorylase
VRKLLSTTAFDIAFALKADGVHLGQDDLPPAEARKILGEKAIIGFSTHNLEQAIEAAWMPIDYVASDRFFRRQPKKTRMKQSVLKA